jgi:Ca-activated chloride channel family protein
VTLRFEQPALLLLALLAVPLIVLGVRALRGMDPVRRSTTLTLRSLLLLLIVAMLAGPHTVRQHDQVTVIGLVDISGSVQRFATLSELGDGSIQSNIDYLRHWFRQATDLREPDDRFGLVAFDGQAVAIAAPTSAEYFDDNIDMVNLDGTNIAEAIRLGLAMFPGDTGRRLVLASDGNETMGDAIEAARQAAGGGASGVGMGVPIDVLPIEYQVTGDVQVARVEAPPTAQPGQTINVRIILESTGPTTGRLTLRREGIPIDLDPQQPGYSRAVTVPAGQSVHMAQVVLGNMPMNRFEAIFEADDPAADVLPENNRAEAFTSTPSRGSVLIVSNASAQQHGLQSILQRAEIPVSVQSPQVFADDLLSLQNYDLIVLDDIPAYDLTTQQHQLIAHYVERLGGGLIVSGGDRSFGAGGWNRTAVADILPVDLDPPRELRAPPSGLVLVLDRSGSMNRPVGGARATQQEVANEAAALAIESLQSETYIGVVAFDHMAEQFIPMQRNDNPAELADRIRTIRAMGGTRIQPALELGYQMLSEVDVQNRHMVLLTDGISNDPEMEQFVESMAQQNVTITTIGVGDDIDQNQLQLIAHGTGGVFYHVRNPRTLPRVLVDSVQEFNKPMLKEGLFEPVVQPTGSTLTLGMDQAPPLGGIVITAPRETPLVSLDMTHPDGEPLLAHWQVGLGRVAAFTSDVDGRWSRRWTNWTGSQTFWTQLVRTISRPAVSRETELITTLRDGMLHINLEAVGEEEGFLDYLQVQGTVYKPNGQSINVRLRQTAPGRYEAQIPAPHAGSYIVALNPQHGSRQLSPVIGGTSRATSEEYRHYQANIALLRDIAETSGGRWLDMSNPTAVNLFDRTGMPRSASFLPVWSGLLWWALALLLLDIACRRIAWNYAMIREAVAMAVAKVTPSHVRGQRIKTTLTSLRTVTQRVEQQQANTSRGVKKLSATGIVAPAPPRPAKRNADAMKTSSDQDQRQSQRKQPDKARVSAALDALLGRNKVENPKNTQASTSKGEETDTQSSEPTDQGSMRENLLAAKQRARRDLHRDE